MNCDDEQRRSLRDALEALQRGDPRRFNDLMWLGFGDEWTRVRAVLVQGRYVELPGGRADQPRLTERGKRLIPTLADNGPAASAPRTSTHEATAPALYPRAG